MLRWVQASTHGEGRRELAWPRRDNQHESRGQCTRLVRSAISDREYLDRGSREAGRDCHEDGAEREIAVVAAGDESRDAPDAVVPGPTSMPWAVDMQRLVSGVSIRRTAGGGLIIEAPPETASTLAALFSGMAQLFEAAAAPVVTGGIRLGGNDTWITRQRATLFELCGAPPA